MLQHAMGTNLAHDSQSALVYVKYMELDTVGPRYILMKTRIQLKPSLES